MRHYLVRAQVSAGGSPHGHGTRATLAFDDWFDPDDDRHLLAFEHFQETGTWPLGFVPHHVELPSTSPARIVLAIARRWLSHRSSLRLRALGVE